MRTFWVFVAMLLAGILSETPAQASSEDPFGDDYVALAVAPTGLGGYGSSGTMDGAAQTALAECRAGSGGECVVAAAIHNGCVAYVLNYDTAQWAGGRGPDEGAASADALGKLPGSEVAATKCSKP